MSIELTPITIGASTGYYYDRTNGVNNLGTTNFGIAYNLNNDTLEPDESIVQFIADLADSFVDARGIEIGMTEGTNGHVVQTDNPLYPMLRFWASRWGDAQAYLLRGATGSDNTPGPEGQMTAMKKEAQEEIERLLASASSSTAGNDGIGILDPARSCVPCGPWPWW